MVHRHFPSACIAQHVSHVALSHVDQRHVGQQLCVVENRLIDRENGFFSALQCMEVRRIGDVAHGHVAVVAQHQLQLARFVAIQRHVVLVTQQFFAELRRDRAGGDYHLYQRVVVRVERSAGRLQSALQRGVRFHLVNNGL